MLGAEENGMCFAPIAEWFVARSVFEVSLFDAEAERTDASVVMNIKSIEGHVVGPGMVWLLVRGARQHLKIPPLVTSKRLSKTIFCRDDSEVQFSSCRERSRCIQLSFTACLF